MSRLPLPPPPPGVPSRPVTGDSYRPAAARNDRFESRDYRDYDRGYDRDRDYDRRAPPPPKYQSGSDSYQPSSRNNRGYESYDRYDRYDGYDRRNAPGTAAPPSHRVSSSVYRPQYDQGSPPPSGDFTFRYDAPPPIAAARDEMYRSRSPQPRRYNDHPKNGYKQDHGRGRQGESRGGYRGRGGPRLASNRAFLRTNRAPTPELMPGMDEQENGVKFKSIEDVSDSEEAEMDMSEDDNAADEQPTKKARTLDKAADGDSVPRWSNPDPYTALPPPDDSQRKKKDVVKLIRKARVEATSATTAKVDPADNFISFDLADDGDNPQDFAPHKSGMGVAGAPTGPRFSHSTNLHAQPPPSAPAAVVPSPVSNEKALAQGSSQTLQARTNMQKLPGRAVQNGQPANNENIRFDLSAREADPALAKESRASRPVNLDTTSDPTLGSRKRTIRDEIKAAPILHKVGKGVNRGKANGEILKEWKPKALAPSTPWLEIDHSDTAKMGLWLHKEIVDFYNYARPRDFESVIRTELVENLRSKLRGSREFFYTDIRPFGSFPAGLYLPTADMDLVCVSDEFMRTGTRRVGQTNSAIRKFGRFIEREGLLIPGSLECIFGAKVPLVKYIDKLTGLKVDISFENTTGLVANQTFQTWKAEFPSMPILVTLIKHLLTMRGLNEPVNGGIGGFSVTCLVVSLLQNIPQVQSRTMIPEHHLGEILMEFFDLYGNEFNTSTTAIVVDRPGYISKAHSGMPYNAKNIDRISIIDPNNSGNDISGGSSNTYTILKCFSEAYRDLQKRMGELHFMVPGARRNESLLKCIFGGNYTSFKLQREHLAHVYENLHGPIEIG